MWVGLPVLQSDNLKFNDVFLTRMDDGPRILVGEIAHLEHMIWMADQRQSMREWFDCFVSSHWRKLFHEPHPNHRSNQ